MKNTAELLDTHKSTVISMLKCSSHNYDRDLAIIEKFINEKSFAKASKSLGIKSSTISRVVHHYAEKLETSIFLNGSSGCDLYLLGLNTRAVNCLKSEGIETIVQLKMMNHVQLLKIPNLGRMTLRMIISSLNKAP